MVLFILAALLTFGFITVLQFIPMPWFFLALLLMHVGIFTFIASKRVLRKAGFNTRTFFRNQYLLLLPYVLIMIYTFACRFDLLVMYSDIKAIVTLAYTLFCLVFTIVNFIRMKNDFSFQLNEILQELTGREKETGTSTC